MLSFLVTQIQNKSFQLLFLTFKVRSFLKWPFQFIVFSLWIPILFFQLLNLTLKLLYLKSIYFVYILAEYSNICTCKLQRFTTSSVFHRANRVVCSVFFLHLFFQLFKPDISFLKLHFRIHFPLLHSKIYLIGFIKFSSELFNNLILILDCSDKLVFLSFP